MEREIVDFLALGWMDWHGGSLRITPAAMLKIKRARSADCVVAGLRWYKNLTDTVGSLLLGLYDAAGTLHHVGVTSSFTMAMRRDLAQELAPLRDQALEGHPWRAAVGADAQVGPGDQSRWSRG